MNAPLSTPSKRKGHPVSLTWIKRTDHATVAEKLLPLLLRQRKDLLFVPGRDQKRRRSSSERRPNDALSGLLAKQDGFRRWHHEHQTFLMGDMSGGRNAVVRLPRVLTLALSENLLSQEQLLILTILWSFRSKEGGKRVQKGVLPRTLLLREVWGNKRWRSRYQRLGHLLGSLRSLVRSETTPAGNVLFWFEDDWQVVLEALVGGGRVGCADGRVGCATVDARVAPLDAEVAKTLRDLRPAVQEPSERDRKPESHGRPARSAGPCGAATVQEALRAGLLRPIPKGGRTEDRAAGRPEVARDGGDRLGIEGGAVLEKPVKPVSHRRK